MASEHVSVSSETDAPEVTGVDRRILLARQIRLYIETAPVFHVLAVGIGVGITAGMLWLYAAEQLSTILLWTFAIASILLVRLVAWSAYSRVRPNDDAVRGWLKWFVAPHASSMAVIGATPLMLVPSASGHEAEILLSISALVYVVTMGSTFKLAAYLPVVPIILGPMVLAYGTSMLRFPGIAPKLLAFGGVVVGVWGYRMATSLNRSIVQSMELSIRNENLVAALEARSARLGEQTAIAEDARRAAERAEQAKTRFLAAASHDLRQPMHAISLMVGMLRPHTPDSQREVIERLERSVEAMDKLFSTILDLSKLDSGAVKPAIANVLLRVILDSIQVHFAPQAASRQLALLVFPSRAIVRTDRDLMERVLRNLVSNAIKYTPKGRVLVGCRRRGKRLLVGVWDTGVGIAAGDLRRIFEEYVQVGRAPRDRSQGLGLGLAIVQRLAKLLDTEVEVASVLGRGSRFGLEVPLEGYLSADEESLADGWTSDSVLSGKLILVVDDEADVRFGTETLLRQWGCHTACAGSFEEVGAILERELRFPDMIITDYWIGGPKTGLDVIAAVRAHTNEETPSIIVTGEDLAKIRLEGTGSVRVIKKPLSAEQLRQHLVQHLTAELGRAPRAPALTNEAR
jgi:two-component system, sensor histidine kinase